MKTTDSIRYSQHGAAIVEFALVAMVFFTLLIGIMEMGRVMFYWNTATELTRYGARIAVVCDPNTSTAAIAAKLAKLYPLIPNDKINIAYTPAGCTASTCEDVTVTVSSGISIQTYIPLVPLTLSLPEFKTTLPAESLRTTFKGETNPVCS